MEEEDIDTTDCYCDICEEDGTPMSAKTKEQQEGLCWDCVKFDENKKQEKKKAFKEVIDAMKHGLEFKTAIPLEYISIQVRKTTAEILKNALEESL